MGLYKNADALLFPSYIETLGLPLLEAAAFGLPVLAADVDYAHEVLKDYEGVRYIDVFDYEGWARKIKNDIDLCHKIEKAIGDVFLI